jgi:hypothetical protein
MAIAVSLAACGTTVAAAELQPRASRVASPAQSPTLASVPASATHATKRPSPKASKTKQAAKAQQSSISSGTAMGTGLMADPSGENVPVGNLPGWKQVFHDNFQGESAALGQFSNCSSSDNLCTGLPAGVQSEWWDYPDGWADTAGTCEYEPSQTLSISGNILNMFIHTSSSGACMAAAPVAKLPNGSSSNGQLYGMYSVRMRADSVTGYLAAFLLWPDSENWPQDGEIDFPDGELGGPVGAFMHYQGGSSGSDQDAYVSNYTFSGWHTYTMQWAPGYVKFMIDGNVIGDSTNASLVPDTPMHWVMQTESDLDGAKPDSSAQGNLQIAWAAVWSYDPSLG